MVTLTIERVPPTQSHTSQTEKGGMCHFTKQSHGCACSKLLSGHKKTFLYM